MMNEICTEYLKAGSSLRPYKKCFKLYTIIFIIIYVPHCQCDESDLCIATIFIEQDGQLEGPFDVKKPIIYHVNVQNRRSCQIPIEIKLTVGPESNKSINKTYLKSVNLPRSDEKQTYTLANIIFEDDFKLMDNDFGVWVSNNSNNEWRKAWYKLEIGSIIGERCGFNSEDGTSLRHPVLIIGNIAPPDTKINFINESVTPSRGNLLNKYKYCIDVNSSSDVNYIILEILHEDSDLIKYDKECSGTNFKLCFEDIILDKTGQTQYRYIAHSQGSEYPSRTFTGPYIEQIKGRVYRDSNGCKNHTLGSLSDKFKYCAEIGKINNFTNTTIYLSIGYPKNNNPKYEKDYRWISGVRSRPWNGQEYCNFSVNDLEAWLAKYDVDTNNFLGHLKYRFTTENDAVLGEFSGPEIYIIFQIDESMRVRNPIDSSKCSYSVNVKSIRPMPIDLVYVDSDGKIIYWANKTKNYTSSPFWELLTWEGYPCNQEISFAVAEGEMEWWDI